MTDEPNNEIRILDEEDDAPGPCGARPRHGTARCDRSAGHDGACSAPIAIGGRITYTAGKALDPDAWRP